MNQLLTLLSRLLALVLVVAGNAIIASERPNVIIENHRVLGLSPNDPIEILADPRTEHRLGYLDRSRIGAARLGVKGGNAKR